MAQASGPPHEAGCSWLCAWQSPLCPLPSLSDSLSWPCCAHLRRTSGTRHVPGSVHPSFRRGPGNTGRKRAEGGMQGCSMHVPALPEDHHREARHTWANELRTQGWAKARCRVVWAQAGRLGIPGAGSTAQHPPVHQQHEAVVKGGEAGFDLISEAWPQEWPRKRSPAKPEPKGLGQERSPTGHASSGALSCPCSQGGSAVPPHPSASVHAGSCSVIPVILSPPLAERC